MWIKYWAYSIPGWSRTFQPITSLISRGYCDIQSLKCGDCDSWAVTQCHCWHWGNMGGKDWKQPSPNTTWSNDDPCGWEWGHRMKGLVWQLSWEVMGCRKEVEIQNFWEWWGEKQLECGGGRTTPEMNGREGGWGHHGARNYAKVEEKICGSKECWRIPAPGDGNREVTSQGDKSVHGVTKHFHQALPATAARPVWELSDSSACTLPGTALGYSSSAEDTQHRAELLRAGMDWLCMSEGPGLCKQTVAFICNNLYTIVME